MLTFEFRGIWLQQQKDQKDHIGSKEDHRCIPDRKNFFKEKCVFAHFFFKLSILFQTTNPRWSTFVMKLIIWDGEKMCDNTQPLEKILTIRYASMVLLAANIILLILLLLKQYASNIKRKYDKKYYFKIETCFGISAGSNIKIPNIEHAEHW